MALSEDSKMSLAEAAMATGATILLGPAAGFVMSLIVRVLDAESKAENPKPRDSLKK